MDTNSESLWAQYLEWVALSKLKFSREEFSKYNSLIWALNDIPFSYIHPMDENRYNDGMSMRAEFETITHGSLVSEDETKQNCTVFEMISALAARCENQLMRNVQLGDRAKTWFFEMLKNLDILKWDFEHLKYDYKEDISEKVNKYLKRKYDKDGSNGGMFPLKNPKSDQRNEQIWNQLMAYLQENWMDNDDNLELFK